jgi:CheY-like chemotaxis protein
MVNILTATGKNTKPDLARDSMKGIDTYLDKPFLRVLVDEVQKLDSNIAAFIFPSTNILIFWRKGIVVYKIILDELNTTKITIEQHTSKVREVLRMLDLGLISHVTQEELRRYARKLNLNQGKFLGR